MTPHKRIQFAAEHFDLLVAIFERGEVDEATLMGLIGHAGSRVAGRKQVVSPRCDRRSW